MAYANPVAGKRRDNTASTVAVAAVATADADATYGQPEADLINELKTKLNAALVELRKAGIISA
jgi:hypothetical protein